MKCCNEHDVTLNLGKIEFAKKSISFLGHELSGDGVRPSFSKVEAVQQMLVTDDKKGVQRYLGFVDFVAKFISHLSEHTFSLREAIKKYFQLVWGPDQSKIFEKNLRHPH